MRRAGPPPTWSPAGFLVAPGVAVGLDLPETPVGGSGTPARATRGGRSGHAPASD